MVLASFWALWFGILTSISPCPLATNIAVVSYISKNIDCPYRTFFTNVAYILGKILTYMVLGFIVINGLLNNPKFALFIKSLISKGSGPVFIVIGLVVLFSAQKNSSDDSKLHSTIYSINNDSNLLKAFIIGLLLALSFGPVSAAIFLGSFIPLALEYNSSMLLPLAYGVGTSIPVLAFAVALIFLQNYFSSNHSAVVKLNKILKNVVGVLFIAIGIYFSLNIIK